MKLTCTAFAAISLVLAADAHMFMSTPKPISGSAPKDPLLADGSNFPCHGIALPGSGGQSMPVGSNQLLSWDLGITTPGQGGANTAVHGGGSCQLSVTYETDSEKIKLPSAWKVIYSIEEGCPTNSPGNLGDSYTSSTGGTYSGSLNCITDTNSNGFDCVNQFNFTIPEGLQNGQATLAWTWFNAVGNREMYMNCAAVEISGGADDESGMSDLPELFIANLDGTYGTIGEANLLFPSPGKYVTTKKASSRIAVASATSSFSLLPPCTSCAGAGSGTIGVYTGAAISQATAASSALPTSAQSIAAAATSPTDVYSTPQAGGTSASSAASSIAPATSTATSTAYATGSLSGTNSTSSSGASSSGTSSGTCPSGYKYCSTPVVCSDDGTQFGLCTDDNCALLQDVSAGTTCSGGEVVKRSIRAHRHAAHAHKMFY